MWKDAPHSGKSLKEKESFYEEQNCEWDKHSAYNLVMCLGDLHEHVGWRIDGLDGVHGGYGVGHMNLKGRISIQICLEKELPRVKYMVCEGGKEEDDSQIG